MNTSKAERLRRLEDRPPVRPYCPSRLPDSPSPHHFQSHLFAPGLKGRIAFDNPTGLTIARTPWLSAAEAALVFCSLPEGPRGLFRAVLETESSRHISSKDVSGEIIHCIMGISYTRLIWRAAIRQQARAARKAIFWQRIMEIDNAYADLCGPSHYL